MTYSEEILRRAKTRLEEARQERMHENETRIAAIYSRVPRLGEIDAELRRTAAKVMAAAFQSGGDPGEAVAKLRAENQSLQREREWILESEGIDPTDLEDDPICPVCGGSGYVGERMCECLRELCRQEQKKELSTVLPNTKETFENFRLSYYAAADEPGQASPRELMQMVLTKCRRYAQSFSLKSPSLLFSGGTGLGKTFLSAAVARTVADAGFSVVYETAVRVFSDYENVKFGDGDSRSVRRYTACDLLILDDLGTEMTTQFTQSALYSVVNDRMLAGLPAIISTNLTTDEIRRRYTPQIASRLLGGYDLVLFCGKDIRLLQKQMG